MDYSEDPCLIIRRQPAQAYAHSAEWMPLDELTHAWAAWAEEVPKAAMLYARGNAFLALANEASAYQYSAQTHHRWKPLLASEQLRSVTESLQALETARTHWISALSWGEQFARESQADLETMRMLTEHTHQHLCHLTLLIERLRQEEKA